MIKQTIAAAAAAVFVAATVVAAEQATFITRAGQRHTGEVVFHGGHSYNLIDGNLNLDNMPGGTGNLSEKTYAEDQVAAIDLTNTAPSQQELARLNSAGANQNALALRDGNVIYGHFDNIRNGDTVLFTENGQQRQFSTSQVARIYLDLPASRIAYNAPGATAGNAVATSGQQAGGSIAVQGSRPWTDTGLTVRAGQMVSFQVSGQIQYARQASATAGPEGHSSFNGRHGRYPVPGAPVGALIGRIGNGAAFVIGNAGQMAMPASGRLQLGINDDQFNDNSGSFNVVITPQG